MNNSSLWLMIILSFCLAAVVVLKKESIPERIRRPLAIISLLMVVASFVMLMAVLYGYS